MRILVLLLGLMCIATPVSAQVAIACKRQEINTKRYTICQTDPKVLGRTDGRETTLIRTFLNDASGKPYGGFRRLKEDLETRGTTLVFAVNGGMYHKDLSSVGYYVESRVKLREVNSRPGPGNFHLLPNGIFYIEGITGDTHMGVMEAKAFLKRGKRPDFATQSGPMLVIDGVIHPRFSKTSESRKIRNGVGVTGNIATFVNSEDPVNFYEFAKVFRDELGISNALFLDGTISSLYFPPFGRFDRFFPLGPIIAIVAHDKKTNPIQ